MAEIYDIPFCNVSGETIPSFAVMKCAIDDLYSGSTSVMAVDGQMVLPMIKPNGWFERQYYLNGPIAVPSGQYGVCTRAEQGAPARLDPASNHPYHDSVGPAPGHWGLFTGSLGFTNLSRTSDWDYGDEEDPVRVVVVRRDPVQVVLGTLANTMYGGGDFTLNVMGADGTPFLDGSTKAQIYGQDIGMLTSSTVLSPGHVCWAFYNGYGWMFGGGFPAIS
jgi:hypothetical protein